jgi:hypothetical protein
MYNAKPDPLGVCQNYREHGLVVEDSDAPVSENLFAVFVFEAGEPARLVLYDHGRPELRFHLLAHLHSLFSTPVDDDWRGWWHYMHWSSREDSWVLVFLVSDRLNWNPPTEPGEDYWRMPFRLPCGATTSQGTPCRRMVSTYEGRAYCYQHPLVETRGAQR